MPSAFELARFHLPKPYCRVCPASERVGQFLEDRRMLSHRICHRRLPGLLSQRSSVPQVNGGVFVMPEGFPDIFHRDAGRLSDLFPPLVGQAVPKNDEVMLFWGRAL